MASYAVDLSSPAAPITIKATYLHIYAPLLMPEVDIAFTNDLFVIAIHNDGTAYG